MTIKPTGSPTMDAALDTLATNIDEALTIIEDQRVRIAELERGLRAIIALPDTPVEWMTSQEDGQAGFNEGLEVCREIAREFLGDNDDR